MRRPQYVVRALVACAVVAVLTAWAPALRLTGRAGTPLAQAVESVGFTVSDVERSVAFFRDVLMFQKVSDHEVTGAAVDALAGVFGARVRVVRMRLGDEELELTEYLTPRGRPAPVDSRSHDRWFQHVAIIVRDMDAAYARLRAHRVEHVSPEPQRLPDWNRAAAGIRAFYFKDPDGHPLEILQFPPDKGQARWHAPTERLFLGIDHTAMVVGDTERSLGFYRDRLGMTVAGESHNHGPEQERLNQVFGARLHITTLTAAGGGPAVEFLEYLTPRDGRPAPPDLRPNDLVHWETTVRTADAGAAAALLRAGRVLFVSPDVVQFARERGIRQALLVRDPDGHAIKVVER